MKNGIINKIINSGLQPMFLRMKENLNNQQSIDIEKHFIKLIGRRNLHKGPLANLTDGGEGNEGWIVSNETKELWSKQRKGKKQTEAQYKANCSRGPMTEEHRRKISESQKGKTRLTPEQYKENGLKQRGKKMSQETKDKMSKQRKGKKQTEAQYKANCNRIATRIPFPSYNDLKILLVEHSIKSLPQYKNFVKQMVHMKLPIQLKQCYELRNEWISYDDIFGRETVA
jgi:hypothetical protein